MSGPRFDEIEGEEETAPSFDAIEGEEETPATPSHVAPNGPVLRAPAQSAWNTLRSVAEASGTVPRGIIPDEGTARGAVASALQGPTYNWADEVAGLVRASQTAPWDPAVRARVDERASAYVAGGMDPDAARQRAFKDIYEPGGVLYREGREAFRNVESAFRKENPAAAFALTAGSGAALGGPVQVTGKGLARYLPALVEGGIAGAGSTEEAGDIGEAAAVGAPLGVAGQAFGEVAGDVIGEGVRRAGQSRLFTGIVKPSPAAEYLRSKHVGDLTIGQMAPESPLAQVEEAATSTAGMGPAIKAQRDAGQRAWQQAVVREALPPGSDAAVGDDLGEQMASVFGGFEEAYAPAKGLPIAPESLRSVLSVVDDPSIYASDSTRKQVGAFIRDQLSALRVRNGAIDSGDVLNLRSFLRQELRNLPDDARQERALFENAVGALSDALESQLPEDAVSALRAADVQYAKAKTVADAVGRARDQVGGFTTKQLSTAVAQNTPTSLYQQGGGGELRRLAQAGEKTVGAKIPVTGARLLSAGPVPYLTAPLASRPLCSVEQGSSSRLPEAPQRPVAWLETSSQKPARPRRAHS
jgi:hypothetical protein